MYEGEITISRLRFPVFIGVPDEERAEAQEVEVTLEIIPETSLFGTDDNIERTVDYFSVSQRIIAVAQSHPRRLIEQLNEDILEVVLAEFPVRSATVTTYKFIIENTEHVAIRMSRSK